MITYVWAEDQKHQIGVDGHLPWHLPADMKHYKEETMGHPMIMGRRTFASFPKVLPGRKHIVLSRNEDLAKKYADNKQVLVLPSLDKLNDWLDQHKDEKVCAVGGASIFKALLNRVDCLEKTQIDATFKADTVMPAIDYSQFTLIKNEHHDPDSKNKYPYSFLTYMRKGEPIQNG